jgi:hypothetical protein
MMKDWTDIIGEELENIEEPLPADDWSVLQQKYAASRRKKRAAAFAWAGGFASAAAAAALVLLLARPDISPAPAEDDIYPFTPDLIGEVTSVPSGSASDLGEDVTYDEGKPKADRTLIAEAISPETSGAASSESFDDISAEADEVTSAAAPDEVFDVVRDTTALRDRLLADASASGKDEETEEQAEPSETFRFEDLLEEEPVRKRRPISIGVSGAKSDSPIFRAYDMFDPNMPEMEDSLAPEPGDSPDSPTDTASTVLPQAARGIMKGRSGYTDTYDHDIPVSFGVSARVRLTDRISFSTGVNYTRYTSTRKRRFIGTSDRQTDRQYVHYVGIPLRFDWSAVQRKHFSFYMGAGMQMDKCVYATVGKERLYEKPVLFGIGGTMGLQYNITSRVGLYFEPEAYWALNEGTIETFRSDEPFVLTMRGGLRFSF